MALSMSTRFVNSTHSNSYFVFSCCNSRGFFLDMQFNIMHIPFANHVISPFFFLISFSGILSDSPPVSDAGLNLGFHYPLPSRPSYSHTLHRLPPTPWTCRSPVTLPMHVCGNGPPLHISLNIPNYSGPLSLCQYSSSA